MAKIILDVPDDGCKNCKYSKYSITSIGFYCICYDCWLPEDLSSDKIVPVPCNECSKSRMEYEKLIKWEK